MNITTLVVIFSALMPKRPGGLEVRASDCKTQVQSLARTQIFSPLLINTSQSLDQDRHIHGSHYVHVHVQVVVAGHFYFMNLKY